MLGVKRGRTGGRDRCEKGGRYVRKEGRREGGREGGVYPAKSETIRVRMPGLWRYGQGISISPPLLLLLLLLLPSRSRRTTVCDRPVASEREGGREGGREGEKVQLL